MTGTREERYRILGVVKCRDIFFSVLFFSFLLSAICSVCNAFLHILSSFRSPHAALEFKLVLFMPCREYTHNSCGFSLSNKGASLSLSSSTVISSPSQCCTPRSTALGGMSTLLTTWMTPSDATPSSTVTVEKALILISMNRPYRATSTLRDLSFRRVSRSI